MTPRAITPFFRWVEKWVPSPRPPGLELYPAPACGNHPGEATFLALFTSLLSASVAIPATAGLTSLWLRVPVAAGLIFLLPHLVMALVALLSPWLAGPRLSRVGAQDWCCLAVMTAYAAMGVTGGGWEAAVCQAWLAFAAGNLVLWLLGKGRGASPTPDQTAPPAPSPSSSPPLRPV